MENIVTNSEDESSKQASTEESSTIPNLEYNQSNSSSFVVPPNIQFAISVSCLVTLSERAFFQQEFLTQVHLNEGIQTIGEMTFFGSGLVEIQIPSTVQTVGRSAFAHCSSLKRAVFSQSSLPCELGPQVFANCESLETLHLLRDGCKRIPKEFCMESFGLMDVVVPALLTSIGESAFARCRRMNYICLPETLENIGSNAFIHCRVLTTVTFSEKLPATTVVEPSVRLVIGSSAFEDCSCLKNLHLPRTLYSLGERALSGCYNLTSLLALPLQLQVLGPRVLDRAIRLQSIRIPKHVRCIPHGAFYKCEQLKVVKFDPHGELESIESEAFGCCEKLSSIWVPSFVKRIGRHAFSRCRRLTSVELPDATAVDPSAFSSCHVLVNLKVANPLPFQDSCTFEENTWHPDGFLDCIRIQQVYYGDQNGNDDSNTTMDENPTTTRNRDMCFVLRQQLRKRWSRLPIHRFCYYQIHNPPEETVRAMQRMQQLIRNRITTYEFQPFDEFGMSPFHILAMSTNPRYQVFAQLMRFYSVNILFTKNPWGLRPATCAFRNAQYLDYTTVVHQYIRAIVSVRIPQLRWKPWRFTIYQLLEAFCPEDLPRRARHLVRLQRRLAMLERLESLALLEHAVWKNKLKDGTNSTPTRNESTAVVENSSGGQRKRIRTERERNSEEDFRQACRTVSGATVVISRVLPYLEDWRST